MKAEQREHEVLRGRCTGLPECCITYFVDVWIGQGVWFSPESAAIRDANSHVFYVRCPDCMTQNNRVTPRRCHWSTCTCGEARERTIRVALRKQRIVKHPLLTADNVERMLRRAR